MPDPWLTLLVNAPAAVAVIYVVKLFLKDRKDDRTTWENHLSSTVRTLEALHQEQKAQGREAREHYRAAAAKKR